MSTVSGAVPLLLAGQLDELGNSWIDMLKEWATRGLSAALLVIVVVYMVQRFSIKAGIGALLLMIIALGLYAARDELAGMVEDEVKHPRSAPAVVIPAAPPLHAGGMQTRGVL